MKFGVLERIVLQSILPQELDYITYKIVKDLKLELSFSEKEIKEFNLEQVGERITWDKSKEKTKEIPLGEKARSVIVKGLEKLNSEGKINDDNVGLYEKFIMGNDT
jgi:hypothetical protein